MCCENIAGGNVCNCERDEGRPLVTVLQERVANQCMLLCLRDKVVSDTPKGDINRQVTIQEMTARELLMKHRKLFRRCQNRVFSVRPGINPEGTCLRSGWHPVQREHDLYRGFFTERRNLRRDVKGEVQAEALQEPAYRGPEAGADCSVVATKFL